MIVFYSDPPFLYPVPLPAPFKLPPIENNVVYLRVDDPPPLFQNRLVQKDPAAVNNNASHSFKCALQKGWYKII